MNSSVETDGLGAQYCPRCGKTMARRLNELECDCGYFVHAEFAGRQEGRTPKPVWHREERGTLSLAAGKNAGKFLRVQSLSRWKLVYLLAFGPVFAASLVLRLEVINTGSAVHHLKELITSTLTAWIITAALLYLDWQALRLFGAVAAWLASAVLLAKTFLTYDQRFPMTVLPPLMLCICCALLAILLTADWREERRLG